MFDFKKLKNLNRLYLRILLFLGRILIIFYEIVRILTIYTLWVANNL